jgi:flagellar motor switch protein FliM
LEGLRRYSEVSSEFFSDSSESSSDFGESSSDSSKSSSNFSESSSNSSESSSDSSDSPPENHPSISAIKLLPPNYTSIQISFSTTTNHLKSLQNLKFPSIKITQFQFPLFSNFHSKTPQKTKNLSV